MCNSYMYMYLIMYCIYSIGRDDTEKDESENQVKAEKEEVKQPNVVEMLSEVSSCVLSLSFLCAVYVL